MAVYYRTKGFIFKKAERSEADKIFTIFTEDFGKLEVRARAIRKITSKLRGGIDKFYLSEVEFIQGKNHKTLTDAVAIKKFGCPQNFENLMILNKIGEVLDNFIKGQEKDEKIWNLIADVSHKINEQQLTTNSRQLLYFYFIWNFFSELGYMPEIHRCAKCHDKLNPYSLYFSNKDGGIICKTCFTYDDMAKKINSDIVKILRLIIKKDWQVLVRLKVELSSQNLLKQISDNYYLYMLAGHSSY